MQEQGQPDDEDDQRPEPDTGVQQDVLEGGQEAVVLERPREVPRPGPAAAACGEGEDERVDHRRDPEPDQERQVGQDERHARAGAAATDRRAVEATRSRGLRGRRGQRG